MELRTRAKPLVLIVEDDPWIRTLSSELLEDEGFAIASAADGRAGLNKAERLRPAAILLDLGLPDMSGREFLGLLRGQASVQAIPVIVVSAQPEAMLQDGIALADGFLRKPVDLTQLMQRVRAATVTQSGAGFAASA
jgi:DNA-binding response OmpR family regulator